MNKLTKVLLVTLVASTLSTTAFISNADEKSNEIAIGKAINNTQRPSKDLLLDNDRKPGIILDFFQVKPETQILEVFGGGGYYTELLNSIVGDKGQVTVLEDTLWYDYSKKQSDIRHQDKRLKNTITRISDMNTLKLPKEKYDTALIILGLHDIYLKSVEASLSGEKRNAKHFIQAIYNSLKSGAVLGVVEHEANSEFALSRSAELHRLSSKHIKNLMLDAGFKFETSSLVLQNTDDLHDKVVWAKGLRWKSDRSVLRFRK